MQKINREQTLETLGGLALALSVIGIYFETQVLLYIGLGCLALALLVNPLARGIVFVMKKVATFIGGVISKLILALVYYLVLTPVALIVRVFRPDPLILKPGDQESYFQERNKTYTAEDFEKIF